MYWHSNDLCAKLTFETKLCTLAGPVYSESIYFQFHFPSIHEWLWFRLFWHKIFTQPSHGQIVEITSKKKHFDQIMLCWGMTLCTVGWRICHYNFSFLLFLKNHTFYQTTQTLDWHAVLFLFQRVKRQSKPTKPVVSFWVTTFIVQDWNSSCHKNTGLFFSCEFFYSICKCISLW